MTELRRHLDRLAAGAAGPDAAGGRLLTRVDAMVTRVRRRRARRAAGATLVAAGAVAVVGLGALALADRTPVAPASSLPGCGEVVDLAARGVDDLSVLVRVAGDLPDLSSEVNVMAIGATTYTTSPDDPVRVLVLDRDGTVIGLHDAGGIGGEHEPLGAGSAGGGRWELRICGAGESGTLADGSYSAVAALTVTAADGERHVVIGDPLDVSLAAGRVTTPDYTARVAALEAATGAIGGYGCAQAIPDAADPSGPLAAEVTVTGTPGPGRDVTVATRLTATGTQTGSPTGAAIKVHRGPAQVQVLADGIPVLTALTALPGGGLAPGASTDRTGDSAVVWCLSGADRLADGEYQTRVLARVVTDGGLVDVTATGTVQVVDGELVATVDGPVLRHPSSGEQAGEAAELRGRLELEGECLYLALDEVGERYPVVWPAGTTWDPQRSAVVTQSGVQMPVGGAVVGGGGYHDIAAVTRLLGSAAGALAGMCVDNTYGEIAVANADDGAIGPAD